MCFIKNKSESKIGFKKDLLKTTRQMNNQVKIRKISLFVIVA